MVAAILAVAKAVFGNEAIHVFRRRKWKPTGGKTPSEFASVVSPAPYLPLEVVRVAQEEWCPVLTRWHGDN
jgi:hypothetical protein